MPGAVLEQLFKQFLGHGCFCALFWSKVDFRGNSQGIVLPLPTDRCPLCGPPVGHTFEEPFVIRAFAIQTVVSTRKQSLEKKRCDKHC